MKIPVHTDTIGLDRYPEDERCRIYGEIDHRLKKEDVAYRKRCSAHFIGIVAIVAVQVGAVVGNSVSGIPAWFHVLSLGVLQAAGCALILFQSFRLKRFMNERVGGALLSATV